MVRGVVGILGGLVPFLGSDRLLYSITNDSRALCKYHESDENPDGWDGVVEVRVMGLEVWVLQWVGG